MSIADGTDLPGMGRDELIAKIQALRDANAVLSVQVGEAIKHGYRVTNRREVEESILAQISKPSRCSCEWETVTEVGGREERIISEIDEDCPIHGVSALTEDAKRDVDEMVHANRRLGAMMKRYIDRIDALEPRKDPFELLDSCVAALKALNEPGIRAEARALAASDILATMVGPTLATLMAPHAPFEASFGAHRGGLEAAADRLEEWHRNEMKDHPGDSAQMHRSMFQFGARAVLECYLKGQAEELKVLLEKTGPLPPYVRLRGGSTRPDLKIRTGTGDITGLPAAVTDAFSELMDEPDMKDISFGEFIMRAIESARNEKS